MHAKIATVVFLLGLAAPMAGQTQPAYEQVLVPFDTALVEGTDGALWSAELRVRNDGDGEVNLFPEQCPFLGRIFPCTQKILVPGHTTQLLDVLTYRTSSIPGLLLYVPHDRVDDVNFNLCVRDARSSDAVGTTIPVVRARNFRSRYTIVGIPISVAQRRTLRVYDPSLWAESVFRIRVFDEADNRTLLDREYMRFLPTDAPIPALVPETFDFSDALAGLESSGVRYVSVSIERLFPADGTFWPMVSTTDITNHRIAIFVAN